MATNDYADVTAKILAKQVVGSGGYATMPPALNHSAATIAGMSEATRTNLERQLGGRITGGEGGKNAQ